MNIGAINHQERVLIATEIRQFFLHPRSLHFIPLTVAGILLVFWPYVSSPFVAVLVVVLSGLEPQFNNILFRTPHELESLTVLPIAWQQVIRAKNFATLVLVIVIFPVVAATILYFSPTPATLVGLSSTVLYTITVLFPLIHIGNVRSVQHPRRATGWQFDDIAGIVELLISTAILSIPFLIFVNALNTPALCVVYSIGTIIFWWRYSIRKTEELIETQGTEICLNM